MRQVVCGEGEGKEGRRSTPEEKGLRKSASVGLILREPMRWVSGEEGREIRAKED